ncbi:MAG: hypothetical protein M1819_003551 [Sarea resinae]|nr:MAG: hypothetical protein M1819_003551 [Sarea resinae]
MVSLRSALGWWCAIGAIVGLHAAPAPGSVVFEQLSSLPQGWELVGVPDPLTRLRLRIAVTRPNIEHFEQTVLDISTPGHKKYGRHLTRDELKARLRPTSVATSTILNWLEVGGVPSRDVQDDGEWINFYATVNRAERLLNTTFLRYHNTVEDIERIRTLQYSVPQVIQQHIDMIQPTTRFGQPKAHRSWVLDKQIIGPAGSGLNVSASCNTSITPTCLKELYKFNNYTPDATNGNKLGICGYLKEYAKYGDLEKFLEEYAPYAAGHNYTFQSVNGGLNNQTDTIDDDVEANLDAQYALSLTYPVPATYYSTGGLGELVPDLDQPLPSDDDNEPYLDFLNYILGLDESDLPQTLTTSYGEDEQSVPEPYTRRVCSMFAELGSRGVSVLFSSGDTGCGSACQTNDGKNTTRFLPIFPAACPWVTSVGGTWRVAPEQAISFSSGGFSDRFPRPHYQDAAVKKYLGILGNRWKGLYNPNGRGFPDVAAQAESFHVIDQGQEIRVGGTSAAAPTFASVISLVNGARISAGKRPLGFLNPWIYEFGHLGLTDIVNGGSTGCSGIDQYSGLPTPYVPWAGWNATVGWDPVTGYGTPQLDKLIQLALSIG